MRAKDKNPGVRKIVWYPGFMVILAWIGRSFSIRTATLTAICAIAVTHVACSKREEGTAGDGNQVAPLTSASPANAVTAPSGLAPTHRMSRPADGVYRATQPATQAPPATK